jgi:hypothetical protein
VIAILERSRLLAWVLVLALTVPGLVIAQPGGAPPAPFNAEQLEQLAAPVALYPDPLLAQVLMASTYPLEIVQAARFVKDNPKITGDKLNEALKNQTWDDSVKSLISFPQVLSLMDQKLDWVQKLGDAFLAQQKDLLDAVQRLRARAHAQGNLQSTAEQTVTVEPVTASVVAPGAPAPPVVVQQPAPTVITIEPANPQVVYVPAYNPTVVYGAWPYPAYPPYYPYPPGYAWGTALLSFGAGMAVGAALWGNCNWGGGNVDVNVNNYNSYSNNVNRSNVANERVSHYQQGDRGQRNDRGQGGNRAEWKHNPENRRGVQYRDQATQQRFNRGPSAGQQPAQSREAFRGRAEQGRQELGRGGAGGPGSGPQAGARPGTQPGGGGGFGGAGGPGGGPQVGARPSTQPGGGGFQGGQRATAQPRSGGGSAFQGMGGGGDARSFSNRGQSSRQSSFGAGGGGGARAGGGGGGGGGGRGGGGGGGGGRGGGRR